jgi:hypothetical protein
MKPLIQVLVTVIVCFILQYFLPWWTMALGAFGVGYFFKNNGYLSFCAGLVGVGLLWVGMSYYIDVTTHAVLTEKINKLLPLNALVMTGIVGGLVGGFASLTGSKLSAL